MRLPSFSKTFADGVVDGIQPDLRLLFEMTGRQAFDQAVGGGCAGEERTGFDVERDRFGALRAAVDAEAIMDAGYSDFRSSTVSRFWIRANCTRS